MGIQEGSTVTIDYKVFVDGQVVDQTIPGQPLTYVQGAKQIIPGLEKNLAGMETGDKKEVVVEPADAYGDYSDERVLHIPKGDLPPDIEPEVGMELQASSNDGDMYVGIITTVADDHIDVDFNHPMAGKTLTFEIEILSVEQ